MGNNAKLKWKVFGFFLAFCTVLLILFWLFQTVFLNDMYKMIRRFEIQQAIQLVEKNINSSELANVILKLDEEKEIMVTLTNEFQPPVELGFKDKQRKETLTTEKIFILKDGREISLTFHAVITPVNATVSTLQVQLYIITVAMLLLSVCIAFLLAKRVARPIEELNKSAKQLSKGKYDTKFEGHGFIEIEELSNTLNTAAKELSKVDEYRKELLANVSHDLRTPLALIYSYAEMMQDFPEEINQDQIQVIMDESKRLTSLVNDILDISKIENGKQKLRLSKYDVVLYISNVVHRIQKMVEKDGYSIIFNNQTSVYIEADEARMSQAIYNLIINAMTHGGLDKKIVIRLIDKEKTVRLEVQDYGEGILEEEFPYIWERYYKVDKIHKRAKVGSGLGLAIVKQVVDLHNGAYGVISKQNEGSIFWIEISKEAGLSQI